jgi:hypothetical protein
MRYIGGAVDYRVCILYLRQGGFVGHIPFDNKQTAAPFGRVFKIIKQQVMQPFFGIRAFAAADQAVNIPRGEF